MVMGILNVTPDSFSDGGRYLSPDDALRQAERLKADGADIIDIGGESTRPGAPAVSIEEELDRLLPLLEALRAMEIPLSVDTYKPAVMRAALAAGADLINDIWGFRQPGAIDAVRDSQCGLCVMHMLGEPGTMQVCTPVYRDVTADVGSFLAQRVEILVRAGVAPQRICVDPGFGFGKTVEHNYALLAHLFAISPHLPGNRALPILAGISRKSMLGAVIDRQASERLAASVAAAVCAAERGADIVRVHDVAPTVDALKIWSAVRQAAQHAKSPR